MNNGKDSGYERMRNDELMYDGARGMSLSAT